MADLGLKPAPDMFIFPQFCMLRTGRNLRHPNPIPDQKKKKKNPKMGLERGRNLPKVMQHVSGRNQTRTQVS